jgi:hypothetical protein
MTELSTPSTLLRMSFFWWQNEVARTTPVVEDRNYLRCDTDYIPSSTADMWRTARRPAAA